MRLLNNKYTEKQIIIPAINLSIPNKCLIFAYKFDIYVKYISKTY